MGNRQFLLGLGSNIGNRTEFITHAIDKISHIPGLRLLAISDAFDSDPVGYLNQPNFINLCIAIIYNDKPESLLRETAKVESELGRTRTVKNGPRTVDIDLLFCEQEIIRTDKLTLPHPRWRERGFVIYPLRQILQSPALVNETSWDWLRQEVAQINISNEGLRLWNGPTPWNSTKT